MRRAPALLVLALAAATSRAPAQARGTPSARSSAASPARAVLALEESWAQGLVRRDVATFRRLLAPEFVYTENGQVMTRDEVLASVTGTDTVSWAGNEGMKTYVYGSTVVVTGTLIVRGRGAGGAFDHRYRFTDVWVRRGGRWQIVAAQDYLPPA